MVLKKTPDNLIRSPEEPYYLKDMEENAKDLLSLSRGRGLQMEKERNIDKEQRFRTPSQSNVSHSIQQNSTIENFIYNHENLYLKSFIKNSQFYHQVSHLTEDAQKIELQVLKKHWEVFLRKNL